MTPKYLDIAYQMLWYSVVRLADSLGDYRNNILILYYMRQADSLRYVSRTRTPD